MFVFFQPIYIPRAPNEGTCLQQGDLFYSAGLHRNHVLATVGTGKIGRGFGEQGVVSEVFCVSKVIACVREQCHLSGIV